MVDIQLRELNDRFVVLPLKSAQQLMDTDRISRTAVLLTKDSDIDDFIEDFRFQAKTQNMELDAIPGSNILLPLLRKVVWKFFQLSETFSECRGRDRSHVSRQYYDESINERIVKLEHYGVLVSDEAILF